jgi:Glycosyltransferase family 87
MSSRLWTAWSKHRDPALRLGTIVLVLAAVVWLGYQGWRLFDGPNGAIDLRLRRTEVRAWFAGRPVYGALNNAVYPPASYLLMAPLFGWEDLRVALGLWAVISTLALIVLARQLMSASGAVTARERRLAAVLPLALYPVGATIGNGQVGIVVVIALVCALSLLERPTSVGRDLSIAALILCALVKPSLSALFFWIVLFRRGGLRPSVFTIAGYVLLTVVASLWRPAGPLESMKQWASQASEGARWGARHGEGSIGVAAEDLSGSAAEVVQIKSINLHSVLTYVGHREALMVASLVLCAMFGAWVLSRRKSSTWTLMGVTGLVSLFSGYHGWYDHVLAILPLVALLRIAWMESSRLAGVVFVAMALSLLAPGGLYLLPYPWNNVYVLGQAVLWLAVLGFLGARAGREHVEAKSAPIA